MDALSVIMWPTMNRLETVPSIHVSGSIIDTFLGSRMGNLMLEPGTIPLPGISRRDREMEALETWLNDDVIQASSSSPKSKIDSAWVVRRSFESPSESTEHSDLSDGFDDDFSDFISAPTPQNLQNVDSFEVSCAIRSILNILTIHRASLTIFLATRRSLKLLHAFSGLESKDDPLPLDPRTFLMRVSLNLALNLGSFHRFPTPLRLSSTYLGYYKHCKT